VFTLGDVDDRHAAVIPPPSWRSNPGELVRMARVAWQKCTNGAPLEDDLAREIAQGWLRMARQLSH
jgi:hypothetical protein